MYNININNKEGPECFPKEKPLVIIQRQEVAAGLLLPLLNLLITPQSSVM